MKAYLIIRDDDSDSILVSEQEYKENYLNCISIYSCTEVDLDCFPLEYWNGLARPTPKLLKLLTMKKVS